MYQPKYWETNFPKMIGNKDFVEGVVAALLTFGTWKDDIQRIGCLELPIYQVINELKTQLLPKEVTKNGKANN